MGFYRDQVLPRGINFALNTRECQILRRRVTRGLEGTVLEIGFGSGLNVPFYPRAVERVLAVDPATVGRRLAARRVSGCHAKVEYVGLRGEELPVDTGSIDAVLSTWTLCTIPDVRAALGEIRRALKPGGTLHFLEHGLSPELRVARWQQRLNPLSRFVAGGCNMNRKIEKAIQESGLVIEALENYYMSGPRVSSYMYEGVARSG